MSAVTAGSVSGRPSGRRFLISETDLSSVFAPEHFTQEHRAIACTAREFFANKVASRAEAIQH
jgi:hypothetical protein